jgi:hypothetical protein
MHLGSAMQRTIAVVTGILLFLPALADATVYRWRRDGALHFSNDSADVPAGEPDALHAYTAAKPAPAAVVSSASDVSSGGFPVEPALDSPSAYERGFDAALRLSEQRMHDAVTLAGAMIEAASEPAPAPPPPIVIQQRPPAHVAIVRASYPLRTADPYPYIGAYPVSWPWLVSPAIIGGGFVRHHKPFRLGHGRRGGGFHASCGLRGRGRR